MARIAPRCRDFYRSEIPGGRAELLLVLSEDLWNHRLSDSVVVPVFKSEATPSRFCPELLPGFLGDCSRVQNVPHEFFGDRLGTCRDESWNRIRIGVRLHLDLDARINGSSSPATQVRRSQWWPHQGDVRFADHPGTPQKKMFGVITNDQWNSLESTTYCSAVRLTSKTKTWRRRWEVEVDGGWTVCADIYMLSYESIEQARPPAPKPDHITDQQSAEIALKQKTALTLK